MEFLTSIVSGYVAMQPNTALCFALAGAALWLLSARSLNARHRLAATILAALVALAGASTILEHCLGWNLGIDGLLFHNAVIATHIGHPGRMFPATAMGFFLIGTSLLFVDKKCPHRSEPSQWLALAAIVVGVIGQFGYVLGTQSFFVFRDYATMALLTASKLTSSR